MPPENEGVDIPRKVNPNPSWQTDPETIKLQNKKLEFFYSFKKSGFRFVGFCVGIIVLILAFDIVRLIHGWPESDMQEDVFDFLKSLSMIVIGYVFGRVRNEEGD